MITQTELARAAWIHEILLEDPSPLDLLRHAASAVQDLLDVTEARTPAAGREPERAVLPRGIVLLAQLEATLHALRRGIETSDAPAIESIYRWLRFTFHPAMGEVFGVPPSETPDHPRISRPPFGS